jgi:hypothetical protein
MRGAATATCWALTGSARPPKTDRTFSGNFGRRIRRRTGQLPVLAGPGQRDSVDAVPRASALHARQAGSRLPLTAEDRRSQISGDLRVQRRARERLPRPSCPMLPDVLAYHRRDNLPGQIRAQSKAPWTIRQDHPGGKALRQEPLPCNLTR